MHLIISETNLFPELSFRISLRLLLAALAKGRLGRELPRQVRRSRLFVGDFHTSFPVALMGS